MLVIDSHQLNNLCSHYARLANLRVALRNLSKESFQALYTIYVRPILEYTTPVGNPHLKKNYESGESELRGLSCEEWLTKFNLTTLENKKKGDMMKIILIGINRDDE